MRNEQRARSKEQRERTTYLRMLVLVPHRDVRLPLRGWSASLFAGGVQGGWSFPWVAPLAQLERFLSTEELKVLACTLRKNNPGILSHRGTEAQSFERDLTSVCALPTGVSGEKAVSIFGPVLPIDLGDDFFSPIAEAVECRFSPLVLGSALVHGGLPNGLPPPPQLSFRAAALANMSFSPLSVNNGDLDNGHSVDDGRPPDGGHPLDGYSFEWEIGKLCWLPKK